jgi:hypothetical protein
MCGLLSCAAGLLLLGCGDAGPKVYPVTGTVKYEDGSVPVGEIVEVHFQPSGSKPATNPATGAIQPDGSFRLSTFGPEDGALPGEYKVTFNILKAYIGAESLVAPEYADVARTPVTAQVKPGRNTFDFVVKKKS